MCLHCKQTTNDAEIEALLAASGLVVCDFLQPTHSSGTTIDLVLAPLEQTVSAEVLDRDVGMSDHRLVSAVVPLNVKLFDEGGLGRVFWARDSWEEALAGVADSLGALAVAI